MKTQNYEEIVQGIVIPSGLSNEEQSKRYQPLINFFQTETPPLLYRFRRCDENSISAFDQDQIWFAPSSEMNDSFDSLLFVDRDKIHENLKNFLDSFQDGLPSFKVESIPSNILESFRNKFSNMDEIGVADFKEHFHQFVTNQINIYMPQIEHIIQSVIKFACFSESIDSAAMWGYYADSGKGFALAYDFRNQNYTDCTYCDKRMFCHSLKLCSLFKVIYKDIPFDATEYGTWLLQNKIIYGMLATNQSIDVSTIPKQAIPCQDEFAYTKALLHKATSWSHEKEWRLTYSCAQQAGEQPKFVNAKKRPSALYMGQHISPIYEKILRHIAAEKSIPVYKMDMNYTQESYKLVPYQV